MTKSKRKNKHLGHERYRSHSRRYEDQINRDRPHSSKKHETKKHKKYNCTDKYINKRKRYHYRSPSYDSEDSESDKSSSSFEEHPTEKNREPELKGRALTPSVPENRNERSDNKSSDHDTSEQNQPASIRYYRSSNSVDGEAITPSKAYRNNDYRKRSRYLHSDTPSRPLRNIDNRRERHFATIISIRSSSEKSTESSSEDSSQEKRIPKYLYSTDMPKDLYD
ncbi:unnamed protein product [Rhizophagus irregularis]|uniref:Uncharacterized protein n=1 Tax=Rhizophagus irregularis TaxID=588596 RepID=A0A2N1N5P7_9GLOM|nr:hypothetical protein RhiirC2_781275 [Rhizophagus irregularis]CAB4400267.1 unnamed protein product [Rhizophagus irregularis]CAB5378244.1 unnamed protein product [Rhizophagus irregularis]